ncbi:UPF0696 protein C11orf68 homolog [Bemisia tabaci]|uniref:UPF0696 protein C11orf68 homolog n=1 Tax=Bemisia tabaci TaxID=7038 RepID=UPI003B287169
MYTYKYSVTEQKVIADCTLNPTDIHQSEGGCFLWALNDKYDSATVDSRKVGKWMVFLPKHSINAAWDKVKLAVSEGNLWQAKVSTVNPKNSSHVLIIYTKDYTDLNDVIITLKTLESYGIKSPSTVIYYKTDEQTYAGIYAGGKQKPWIYRSDTICEIRTTSSGNLH